MRGFGAACTFAFSLLIGRMLSIEDAGRILWAIAATSLLAVFARGGLDKAFMKMGAVAGHHVNSASAAGMVLRRYAAKIAVASILLGLMLFLYGVCFDSAMGWPQHVVVLAVAATPIVGIALTNAAGTAAIGSGAAARGTLAISVLPSLIALLVLLIAIPALGLAPSALIFAIAYATGWIFTAVACAALFPMKGQAETSKLMGSPAKETRQFASIGMSNTLEQWLPTFIAGIALSATDAAGFALSARLVAVIQLLMVSATSVYARTYANTEIKNLRGAAFGASRNIAILGLPAIAVLFALAPQALSIFGKDYAEASLLLRILLVGQAINMMMGTFSVAMIMHNQVQAVSRIFMASSLVQIVVAAIATLLGSAELLAASSVAAVMVHTGGCAVVLLRATQAAGKS